MPPFTTLSHILVAVDDTETSRAAVRQALVLARAARARGGDTRLTVLTVLPELHDTAEAVARLGQWLAPELEAAASVSVHLGVAAGVPGIEICRFAERRGVDLLVLGRKQRSQMARLLVGDTADAVARRSLVPCLFVPAAARPVTQVLAAVDGGERSALVAAGAQAFAAAVGAELSLVSVDAGWPPPDPGLASMLAAERAERVARLVEGIDGGVAVAPRIEVRHGETVAQVLAATVASRADVLAVGYHRGGPPGVVEGESTARRLAHVAAGMVLTLPL